METPPKQLRIEDAAVMWAFERMENAISVEAAQIRAMGKESLAQSLANLVGQIHKQAERYLKDVEQVIQIAHEMPKVNGVIPGV